MFKETQKHMKRNVMPYYASCNCICKDHRNEMEEPDPVVKELISYKIIRIMKRFDKKARLINGTETIMFVKYPIFRKAEPFFFRVLQIRTSKAKKRYKLLARFWI